MFETFGPAGLRVMFPSTVVEIDGIVTIFIECKGALWPFEVQPTDSTGMGEGDDNEKEE